jgi:DNA invertase Pin-like site-specific DNA recombinase
LTNVVKNNAKEPLSLPPYGYMNDPNSKGWIIDPEAAEIVRRIFNMTLNGKGTEQIAVALTEDKILTPKFYWRSKGLNRGGKVIDRNPHFWSSSTVVKILTMQEYCGDIINLKTYSKSFKLKQRFDNPDKSIHKDVHDPIIDRAVWERIQEKRGKVRKRKTTGGEKNMFSGLLVCADCKSNLHFHFNQKNHDIKYFNCRGNNASRKTCDGTHYIRVDFLENVILQEIRRLTHYAIRHEAEFAKMVMGHSQQADTDQRERKQKELYALKARDRELDKILSKCYEDNISGKLTDERFARLDKQYTLEQKELAEKIKVISAELDKQESKAMTADVFISTVRKYTRAKKLTERMLTEIIERIEVHQAEKVDGIHRQRLTIHYNCVGAIEIPAAHTLPDIAMKTRKGVTVSYEPLKETAATEKKTVLYLRSDIVDDDAIESQETILRAYAEANGYRNIEAYSDNGFDSSDFDRPAINRLSSDIDSGIVGTVIIMNVSRIGRESNALNWIYGYRNKGVRIVSAKGDIPAT